MLPAQQRLFFLSLYQYFELRQFAYFTTVSFINILVNPLEKKRELAQNYPPNFPGKQTLPDILQKLQNSKSKKFLKKARYISEKI